MNMRALVQSRFERCITGAQVGTFDGRSPIHKKGTLKLFKGDTAFEYRFVDSKLEEIMWEAYR